MTTIMHNIHKKQAINEERNQIPLAHAWYNIDIQGCAYQTIYIYNPVIWFLIPTYDHILL